MRIAVMFEHPTWSRPLVQRMRDRGFDVTPVDVGAFDDMSAAVVALVDSEHDVWVNRVNTMPSDGRPPSVVAAAGHLLLGLDIAGQRVINGWRGHAVGLSKAAQSTLIRAVGLHAPAGIPISDHMDAEAAAESVGYPVLTKPNIGGSGAGIVRHETPCGLARAIAEQGVDLGIDGTGLVQEVVPSADGFVHRIEMLFGELFYATDQPIQDGVYNYCAADGCAIQIPDAITLVTPDADRVAAAESILSAAALDVGSVEYLIDSRSGEACFYDINPYSNFVTGRDDELGFDPLDRYIDAVIAHA